jgi:hypothetical protein
MSSDFMSSEDNKDNPPSDGAEEPIVARLADVAGDAADGAAGATAEDTVQGSSEGSGVDDLALTDAPGQSEPPIDEAIRVGSPFAVDPNPIAGTSIQRRRVKPEAFYDVGPLRYTALGAVSAALLVLGFAAAAAWWFPGGGTIIAALGCALSIFGLYSNRKMTASGCLVLHLLLFMISYSRAITA